MRTALTVLCFIALVAELASAVVWLLSQMRRDGLLTLTAAAAVGRTQDDIDALFHDTAALFVFAGMDDQLLALLRFAPRSVFRAPAEATETAGEIQHRLPLWVSGELQLLVVCWFGATTVLTTVTTA